MTKIPKNVNISKFISSLLAKLNKHVNNFDIHKFTIKVDNNRNIKIYVFVDFSSEYLRENLRSLYIEFFWFYIKLKEYIYPLDDSYYSIYLDAMDKYKNSPFIVRLMGKNAKYLYLHKYIRSNYKISDKTQRTIIKMVLDASH